jgi:hypothetical protein
MLSIPKKGMSRSISAHNARLDVMCDWIEASALFQDEKTLPDTMVMEALIDGEIYENQSYAWERVSSAWAEIRLRQSRVGQTSPFGVLDHRLVRKGTWRQFPAYSFCLALGLAPFYPEWARSFGKDYTEQGELFEKLTQTSVETLFPGWKVHPTGWTRTHTQKLRAVVEKIASMLGETIGRIERWTRRSANEAGLDLLLYRPFPDGRVGIPVFLMQCASGADWETKLHTPHLGTWSKIVEFAATPKKAFAMPFAMLDDDFPSTCNSVDGLTLDRYRLLAPGRENPAWLSRELRRRIIAWLEPRIGALLTLE